MHQAPKKILPLVRRFFALCVSVLALVFVGTPSTQAAAGGGGSISYSPRLNTLSGNMPFAEFYVITVTGPSNLSGSSTIGFNIVPGAIPAGMSPSTAQSFISITPVTTGTFTLPNQTLQFTVTGTFPLISPPSGGTSITYFYQIYTTNWIASGSIADSGFSVGATATVAGSGGGSTQPPTVSISSPATGAVLNYPFGTVFPVQVPLTFVAGAPAGSLVDSLTANLGLTILTVTSPALPLAAVNASASMTIPGPGAYTATVGSFNIVGSASATTNFTVVVAPPNPPPDVVISTPADGSSITVLAGALPLSVPVQFTSTSTVATTSPITAVAASFGVASTPIVLTSTGLNTTAVASSGSMLIGAPGSYTITANATNLGGTASDTNTFTVVVQAAPPTVVINTPTVNSVHDYRLGSPAAIVPFAFTATSSFGGIVTLTAKVDGANVVFTPVGLGTVTATGLINLPYTTAGTHTVSVTTTDNNGTATALSNFTVNVIAPTPVIVINQPMAGATFATPVGSTTINVPYTFTTTSNNGFFVDNVSLSLDGNPVVIGGTSGLGTATATSTGTLAGVTTGTHTLVATGISAGISATTSTSFAVTSVLPPPTVVINTPPAGSTFTRVSGGAALSIPLTFTGTSTPTNGVITQLKATLNGTVLTVSSTTLGQRVANGSATMSVTSAGTYTMSVTASDANGTASASRTFSVVVVQPRTICGSIFFDVDCDGNYDCEDFDISGITVKLYNAANVLIGTDVTDCGGDYSFCNLAPGTYRVVATAYAGLKVSTVSERTVTVAGANVCAPRIGFHLDFAAIRTLTANGYTIGYWKNNLDKAIACKTAGTQVSKATLQTYTYNISNFALSSYDNMTMKTASAIMGYSGSNTSSLLSKQLIASEYNYQNAAYLGGNKTLTMAFLWWGEYVLANPTKYGSTYTIWAKDWFDAYNNTHGGAVNGPL